MRLKNKNKMINQMSLRNHNTYLGMRESCPMLEWCHTACARANV